MTDLARIQFALSPRKQAGSNNTNKIISTGHEAQRSSAPDQDIQKKDSPSAERSHPMQFRNSNDGEGKSPRGHHTEVVGSSGKHSVITADDDNVLHEACERNTTLNERPRHRHETALYYREPEPEPIIGMYNKDREWKAINESSRNETVLRNYENDTVDHEPEKRHEDLERNTTLESPYQNYELESPEKEDAEMQLGRINDIKQSILGILAEQNTQNKVELSEIKDLLKTVTKAQCNLAGRLEQVESESAKKNLNKEFMNQAPESELSWGEDPEVLEKDANEVQENYLNMQRIHDSVKSKLKGYRSKKQYSPDFESSKNDNRKAGA